MGHSLGADAAIFMAEKMKALGAPVALVVTFGPTMNLVAPSNVSQVVNYYTGNTLVAKGSGFRGTISNINLNGAADINHLNVEKSSRLHAGVIGKIQTIVGHRRAESMARQGPVRLLPRSKQPVCRLHDLRQYPSVVGHAIIGSTKSIRWLKWLGAKFGAPQGTAIPFRITRHG